MCFLTWPIHFPPHKASVCLNTLMAAAPHLSCRGFPLSWLHLIRQWLKLLFPFPPFCTGHTPLSSSALLAILSYA